MKGFGGSGSRRVAAMVIAVGALGAPMVAQAGASPLARSGGREWTLSCGSVQAARSLRLRGPGEYHGHPTCDVARDAIEKGSFQDGNFSTPGWKCSHDGRRRPFRLFVCTKDNEPRTYPALLFEA